MKRAASFIFVLIILVMLVSCAGAQPMQTNSGPAQETATAAPTNAPSPTAAPTEVPTITPEPTPEQPPVNLQPVAAKIEIVEAYPSLQFSKPLYFTTAGDKSGYCYVVEQTGKIKVFEDSADTAQAQTFLDLGKVISTNGNEKGLLGLAFHPDYISNGYFYVDYTNQDSTVIARYTRSADNPFEADRGSAQVLLTFKQPYKNHNGGQLAFGPDGYLYIGTGDGGSAGDPNNNAQNLKSYLGKILRIDVDNPTAGMNYGIPLDNPYYGNAQGYKEETFAYGLRNPWRFSFDKWGRLWVADVGQNNIEEIDIVENGGNYGWSIMEGTSVYKKVAGADKTVMIPPVWEYTHKVGDCITGGYVYASEAIPELKNRYIYGDYEMGQIWALWLDPDGKAQNQLLIDTKLLISSFGLDESGDIRVVDLSGKIYRLKEAG